MRCKIIHWALRIIAAGILTMGAVPKFTGGAAALADKLPGGNTAVVLIGIAEVIAVVLLLVPKLSLYGAGLAAVLMLGAVGSHLFGPVGMEGDLGAMLPMAIVALVASAASLVMSIKSCKTSCCTKAPVDQMQQVTEV